MSTAHYKFRPIQEPFDVTATHDIAESIFQEFSMYRHLPDGEGRKTAPYIDQAKQYFVDARNIHWRSAGLLYYYSFLNLSKAFILKDGKLTEEEIVKNGIFHGLSTSSKSFTELLKYDCSIHSVVSKRKGQKNIFALFYEVLIQEEWPFDETVSITLKDIIGYCYDISHELYSFYGIESKMINMHSLLNVRDESEVFMLILPSICVHHIYEEFEAEIDKTIATDDLNFTHFQLINSFGLSSDFLYNKSIIQFKRSTSKSVSEEFDRLTILFTNLALPTPSITSELPTKNWHYFRRINLNGKYIKWHPLLSNYIFFFILSDILRYQPHLVPIDSKEAFIAESFITQANISSLRYFLMHYSEKKIRFN